MISSIQWPKSGSEEYRTSATVSHKRFVRVCGSSHSCPALCRCGGVAGPVLFTASLNATANPLLNRNPIELYTEVVDAVTHNVCHMHVDDLSADLAIDSVMLTNTDKTVEQCKDFKTGLCAGNPTPIPYY
jgi:hypothetical protein